ncbi:MAG: hypothetical protein ABI430_03225 [Candidatus Taylorbacteria bacterium]
MFCRFPLTGHVPKRKVKPELFISIDCLEITEPAQPDRFAGSKERHMAMAYFVGEFFFNTRFGMYSVLVTDVFSSPRVTQSFAFEKTRPDGEPKVIRVRRVFPKGIYLGFAKKCVAKYSLFPHQGVPIRDKKPPALGTVPTLYWGSQTTSPPIGLFMKREDCEECFRHFSENRTASGNAYDSRWLVPTIEVLKAIGADHPLVTVALQNRCALPRPVRDCLTTPHS